MGNTCKPMAVSFQCMTKPTTIKKKKEYWSGFPCPPPGDLLTPGMDPRSSTLQVDSFRSEPRGSNRGTQNPLPSASPRAHTPVPSPVFTHSFPGRPATNCGGPDVGTHPAPRARQVLPCLYLAQDTDRRHLSEHVGQAEGGEHILACFAESIQAKLADEALHTVCLKHLG